MGIVFPGIPEQIVIDLARLNGSTIFVETGTYQGKTTRWASRHFATVHTIERAEGLYRLHSEKLCRIPGVTAHLGDSRQVLPRIVDSIGNQPAVYWLDGHWSGGETAGELDECPLLSELATLSQRGDEVILVDDARLFLCAPPMPHDPSQWPTIADILNAIPSSPRRRFVQIVDDVIFIIPDSESLKQCLVAYAQERAQDALRALMQSKREGAWFRTRLKGLVGMVRRAAQG